MPVPAAVHRKVRRGSVIIGHVSNSSPGTRSFICRPCSAIDFSVTKHVFMLWLVAALVFVVVTTLVRRSIRTAAAGPDPRR